MLLLPRKQRAFTLIELVIGIVLFGIVMASVTVMITKQARRSVDPMLQIRATELAQSLLNEISGKSFDEASTRSGGLMRCGESGAPTCTTAADFGAGKDAGETQRRNFDDVDDYHNLRLCNEDLWENQLTGSAQLYSGYCATINVAYNNSLLGAVNSKVISLTVDLPNGQQLQFSTIRSNY